MKTIVNIRRSFKKEVIKMKKMIIVIMALAMVVAFLPATYAADSASLGLTVTFDGNKPLTLTTSPAGPFKVEETKSLYFYITAQDQDATKVTISCGDLPSGATFSPYATWPGTTSASGTLYWTPKVGQAQDAVYKIVFTAKSEGTNADGTAKTEEQVLTAEITVTATQHVIAISLNGPNPWVLDNVKFGEKRTNNPYPANPAYSQHYVYNTGNVPVTVGMGYGPSTAVVGGIQPGTVQGKDTFITMVGDAVISPGATVQVGSIDPNKNSPLLLTYGAPTSLSADATGMSSTYELKAYPVVVSQ